MSVFAISDFHLSINCPKPMDIFGGAWVNYLEEIQENWDKMIGDDDIVLLSGDTSWAMTLSEVMPDLEFLSRFKGHKVLIRGNHDYWWQSIGALRKVLPDKLYALQNDAIRLNSTVIAGSRLWTTPEGAAQTDEDKKIYERELLRLEMSLVDMDKKRQAGDRAVVMTHYPPFNSSLSPSRVTALISKYAPDAVVYGHLHGKNSRVSNCVRIDNIPYYLTSCDLVANKPVLVIEDARGEN